MILSFRGRGGEIYFRKKAKRKKKRKKRKQRSSY